MKEKILIDLGLSKNEARIYLALLEKGACSPSEIAKVSGVHRVNVYDTLTRLKEKGLVGEVGGERRAFQAAPPETLKNIIKEQEIQLNKILPELELQTQLNKSSRPVEVYEGWDFIRNFFLRLLETKQDILALDVPAFALAHVGQYFQEVIHTRRAEQKQWMYHLYQKAAIERIRFLNTLPYTQARYLEESQGHNVTTTICGDIVAIHILSEQQKPLTIHIKNAQVAEAYRTNFFRLWEMGKKA